MHVSSIYSPALFLFFHSKSLIYMDGQQPTFLIKTNVVAFPLSQAYCRSMEAIAEQSGTLLDSIADFCRQHGIAESTFGRRAVNDGKFVARMRDGARITPETLDRVTSFLEKHGASAPATPPELRQLIRVAAPSTPAA